nr:DegT/DnrJ/EryC1/StrS family aminotransferase [uncultured Draconibacterium sp.]
MYKIPLFKLNFDQEEENAILETLRSKWISTGPKCIELENKFAESIGTRYALTTSNCTVALHLALVALGIKENDEVIVPSLTFAATANCVTYTGAKPVFADINSLTDLTISPTDIQRKITEKTKAIIVMHYGGFPCKMDEIKKIAQDNNLLIIEDASHAPLSEYNGVKIGTLGDISCYSFFSNKNISTGEGGMLVTNNTALFEKAKLLRSHGMTTMSYQRAMGHASNYDINQIGFNYRMDDIRASIGLVQLKKLRTDLIKRANIRHIYIERLTGIDQIIIPFESNNNFVSNYVMPVILKDSNKNKRDIIRDRLHEVGIQTSIHYPALHKFSCYDQGQKLPITEYTEDCLISLPMYGTLSSEEIDFITRNLTVLL